MIYYDSDQLLVSPWLSTFNLSFSFFASGTTSAWPPARHISRSVSSAAVDSEATTSGPPSSLVGTTTTTTTAAATTTTATPTTLGTLPCSILFKTTTTLGKLPCSIHFLEVLRSWCHVVFLLGRFWSVLKLGYCLIFNGGWSWPFPSRMTGLRRGCPISHPAFDPFVGPISSCFWGTIASKASRSSDWPPA